MCEGCREREVVLRKLNHEDALLDYIGTIASRVANIVGCLMRMEGMARAQRIFHDLLGTFSELHHSSNLGTVDIMQTTMDSVMA